MGLESQVLTTLQDALDRVEFIWQSSPWLLAGALALVGLVLIAWKLIRQRRGLNLFEE